MMSPSSPPSPFSLPRDAAPIRFGKYLLESRIAVGGSSEVFLARPATGEAPARRLVIKRLLPVVLEDPQSLGTFAMEARLHRAARHPNVVEVYEAGSVDGEPYLAMEFVDGVDTYRLMRYAQTKRRPIPVDATIHIARELCSALSVVHCATDDTGHPLAVVHRDVTPSNIYLSRDGDVKLGDFGIARLLSRSSLLPDTSPLKGKYCYLSPEQVAGENFDHRADLFALGVVLAELIINEALFPGSGQLAVLLAIRDCRLENLHRNASRLPSGLLDVLEQALARSPENRFGSAEAFAQALEPLVATDPARTRERLARYVTDVAGPPAHRRTVPPPSERASSIPPVDTGSITPIARVRTAQGRTMGPLALSKLIEMTTTSRLQPEDEVDLDGKGYRKLSEVEELQRHIPTSSVTTNRLSGPGIPDFVAELSQTKMLEVCAHMLRKRESGVLFAEREGDSKISTRKEIYLAQARVIHVASSEPSELLGEYLVRRGLLDRTDLELALAVLPRYGGRLGDTLIGLNLVDAVQIFRAIRDQGRDRIAEIFRWAHGNVSFYRGVSPHRVEFPLDLDLAPLMLAGMEAAYPDHTVLDERDELLDDMLVGCAEVPDTMKLAAWPPEILKVVGAAGEGRTEREIVTALTAARLINVPSALRAIDVACAAGLLIRHRS